MRGGRALPGGLLVAAALVLAGLNLRIAVASVPPLIEELERDLALSAAAAGLLTTAPVLCFGLLAPVAPALIRRFGAERVLVAMLLALAGGTLGRGLSAAAALFAGTIVAGAAIAVANVVVPTVIKGRFAVGMGSVTGLYAASLSGGAALAGGLTVPLEHALAGGWEAALAIWCVPAFLAAALLAAALVRDPGDPTAAGGVGRVHALLRDTLAWQVTVFMGLQSLVFYAGLAWLPAVLRDEGYSGAQAGAALAVLALGGIPASLAVPPLATRLRDQRALAVAVTALEAAAIAGLLLAPAAAFAWVTLFALGQGGAIALALSLIVLRSPDAPRSADLSGMAQTIGYSLAALGPLLFGALHDVSGGWDLPLACLLAVTIPLLAAGLGAGRSRTVRG